MSPFPNNPTTYRGRELFYSLTPEQQVALFQNVEHSEVMEVLVEEIYGTLADADNSDSNWPVLNAMRDTFPPESPYHHEIHEWLRGRALWREGNLEDALAHYNNALNTNDNNAAVLFERARVLVALERYPEAAHDLDILMGIAATPIYPFGRQKKAGQVS